MSEPKDGNHLSLRQQATQGNRKRRDAKKPLRKKLKSMAGKLHQVLLASAFVLGNMANEMVIEPGMDLMSRGSGDGTGDQPDFLEVFAGSANISGAFVKAR